MDGWRLNLTFAAAHFISDYSKCSRLHGHSYAVSIMVRGEARKGIVVDFVELKRVLREIIEELDHRVIIPTEGEMSVKIKENEVEVIHMGKRFVFPKEDCAFIPLQSSSAENLARYVLSKFMEKFSIPENVEEIEIEVDEGYGQGAVARRKLK